MPKLVLVLLLLLGMQSLYAEGYADKKSAAIRLLDTMNKNGFLDYHIKSQIKMEVASNPLLALREAEVTQFFARELSFNKLKPDLASLYIKELSIKEMEQFRTFFDTSVGQKMIAKMPRLLGLGSHLAEQKIQAKIPELINSMMQRK